MITAFTSTDDSHLSHTPPKASTVGLWIFLAALTMLFASSMLAYLLIRFGINGPPSHSIVLPRQLWISTALVISVSIALWQAVAQVRRERQGAFRVWLLIALVLGAGFIAVQTPAMVQLVMTHQRNMAHLRQTHQVTSAATALYGLIFFLVLLHALHVVGGIIVLVRVGIHGSRGKYDHEHYLPVRHAATYWHFLDVVWLFMFSTFLLTR